jgi:hypothetical protein
MDSFSDSRLVSLRNGPAVPGHVILWMLAAEDRGVQFHVTDDGRLHVGPRDRISDTDLGFIRQHRDLLLACTNYVEQMCEAPL